MNESTGTRFQRLRRTGQVVSLSVGALWLLVVVATPVGRSLARWAEAVTPAWAVVTFVVCLVLVWEVVALPASVYAAVQGDQRFRKGRTPVATIVGHQVRDALTGTVVAVVGALVVWISLSVLDGWWWLGVGVLFAPALVVATTLAGVTVRAASGSLPITREALAERLSQMAEQACGRRVPVREWTDPSTSAPIARVTGMGASLAKAKLRAYSAVKEIRWPGGWCRKDIADKAFDHERRALAAAAGATSVPGAPQPETGG